MSKIIFVEDAVTAANMQRGLDPAEVLFSHPRSAIAEGAPFARFDEVYVRYPAAGWFASTGWSETDFQTWMREHASTFMKRGGDFQQI